MCLFRKKTAFEKCCEEHLKQNSQNFTYVFQDTEFNIEIKSLWPFILNYAQIQNTPQELKAVIGALANLSDEDIIGSLVRLSPSMGDLLSGSHPRFTFVMKDKVFVVIAKANFIPNENHPSTLALYSTLNPKLRLTKKALAKAYKTLLANPELVSEKSAEALKREKYHAGHIAALKRLYDGMLCRIHFRPNSKYGPYEDGLPILYIGFEDMQSHKINIRVRNGDKYDDKNDHVIATYLNLDDVLLDGWELD